jgi:hypothetical protein
MEGGKKHSAAHEVSGGKMRETYRLLRARLLTHDNAIVFSNIFAQETSLFIVCITGS